MSLTKEQILSGGSGLKQETLDVPGLGPVCLLEMHVEEREIMAGIVNDLQNSDGKIGGWRRLQKLYATTAALCLVDDNGNKLFTIDDVPELMKKKTSTLAFIHTAAMELSKVSTEALNTAEKKSEAAPTADSSSS